MPLTKNLYREDEVLSSLKYCVVKGKGQEAIFWAQELLDSEMRSELLEALFWVWTLAVGPANPWWLVKFREVLQTGSLATDEEIQYLVMYLVQNPQTTRDGTALTLLGLGLRQEIWCQERVGPLAVPEISDSKQLFIARALLQGKLPAAWGRAIPLWKADESATWALLKECASDTAAELIHLLQTAPLWFSRLGAQSWTWPRRAAAFALVGCVLPKQPATPWEPPIEWVAFRFQWLTNPMRFRRIFTPQPLALFWLTDRGQLAVSQTTEADIMAGLEASLVASKFWESRIPELTASDESREAFYTRYFPNDIPDEWTSAERQVSHGRGAISDPASTDWHLKFETTLNTWFGMLPTRIWQGIYGSLKGIYAATKFIDGTRPAELFATLERAYAELEDDSVDQKYMVPVRREFVVV